MRVKGLIFVVIMAAIVGAVYFFITDEMIEEQVEKQLSIANRALVEIDDFEFNPTELHVAWSKLQVTDPDNTMMNLFETGETEFDVQFWPLLWNKVIVDNVQMAGFAMETARESDGYFEMPVVEDEPENNVDDDSGFFNDITGDVSSNIAQNASMEFTDVKDDINIDSLIALVDLQSIERMDSLQIGLQKNYSEWDSTITNNSIEENASDIQTLVNSIKIEELDEVPKALAAIETVQKVIKEADSIKTEITTLKDDFQSDLTASRNSIDSIDDWIQDDIKQAENVAKLPEINAQSIGTALFGESLLADLNKYLGYLATGREYGQRFIGSKEEEEEKPDRYEGRNYEFSDKYDLPALWLKNIELSGVTSNEVSLAGSVKNVSNDQNKTGEPITINLSGSNESSTQLVLSGMLDYTTQEKKEAINLTYSGFSLANSTLSPSELLPYELNSGVGSLSLALSVIERRIESRVEYVAAGLDFDFESAGAQTGTVEQLIRNAISGTDQINATALIDNTDGSLKASVQSNIDDLFLNALRNTVQAEVDAAKRQIQAEVEGRVNGKKEEVLALVDEQEAMLRGKYDELEAKINDQLAVVDGKIEELEAKKKELEDALKDDAVDAIRKRIGF